MASPQNPTLAPQAAMSMPGTGPLSAFTVLIESVACAGRQGWSAFTVLIERVARGLAPDRGFSARPVRS